MSTIQDHRDNLIKLFTKSLDNCIAAQKECPGSKAHFFTADIRFEMDNPTVEGKGRMFEIASRPALDLTKPYDPKFPLQARVIKESA